jgi:glycosyltransferase involved in cell wall biosynthesis
MKLGVVVITRNEEEHIAKSLNALLLCVPSSTPVILVDSSSEDRTTEIAQRYPITVMRYSAEVRTAAAGRTVGLRHLPPTEFILFLDGDCSLEVGWLEGAWARLEESPQLALITGRRREVCNGAARLGNLSIGGNALYRKTALREAGGFNAFLAAEEEGELIGRLKKLGYTAFCTEDVMFTHYTEDRGSFQGMRSGKGPGKVLRLAITQGLFRYHAKRFNRYLFTLGFLLAGLAATVASPWSMMPLALWLCLGAAGTVWLCWRHGKLAPFILLDWCWTAINMVGEFISSPERKQLVAFTEVLKEQ